VFSDADPAAAVQGALLGVFCCAGQVCCAGTRLFVERGMHDEFADKLVGATKTMKQGNPLDPETRMGPLVSKEQLDRVTGYLEKGKKEGARAVAGGERNTAPGLEKGYYVKPTVFTGVRNDMTIAREEIFGPVVSLIPFKDENDAVLQGNDTTYGLAAGVWTRDVGKAHRVARALRAGTVWVNTYGVIDASAPFGGYKQSGYGRELGKYALDLYTQVKTVMIRV
jgi:aldehyde dehydrogenase (NAD+)